MFTFHSSFTTVPIDSKYWTYKNKYKAWKYKGLFDFEEGGTAILKLKIEIKSNYKQVFAGMWRGS